MAHFNAEQDRARKHPGAESRKAAIVASQWLWLMPALLLRRTAKNTGDQALQVASAFSFRHCVKRRIQLAETAQWHMLLGEYVAHLN